MKRLFTSFLAVALLLCLPGCKAESTVLHRTEGYTIRRVGSQCYLDMTYGNQKLYLDESGCVIYPHHVEFESVEQLYQAFLHGTLAIEDLQVIQYAFPLDDHGFLIPDPQKLYDIELPADMACSQVDLAWDGYTFHIRSASADISSAQLSVVSEEEFRDGFRSYRDIETGEQEFDSVTQMEDRNATAYDYTNHIGQYRMILYRIEDAARALNVIERYQLSGSNASATVPYEIMIYGQMNGAYYTLDLNVDARPEVSRLKAISLIPYQPG